MQSIHQAKEEELRWDCGTPRWEQGRHLLITCTTCGSPWLLTQCSAVPQEFEGKTFTDVTREDLEIDESEEGKKESANVEAELKDLTSYVKKVMGRRVAGWHRRHWQVPSACAPSCP